MPCTRTGDRYDHIVPTLGYCTQGNLNDATVLPGDRLGLASLFTLKPAWWQTSDLPASPVYPKTADSCKIPAMQAGCLPSGTDYAIAILGIKDDSNTSLPVLLEVNSVNEPNTPLGKKPSKLKGWVTVSSLTVGGQYSLLRFDSILSVPTSGGAAAFLAVPAASRKNFTATDTTWTYKDPNPIMSDGATFYRCVELP